MKPVNGYLQVEMIEDSSVFKTSYDKQSPQPMKVIGVSFSWVEYGHDMSIPDITEGDIILASHVYPYMFEGKELLFAKYSDVVAIV